MKRATSTALAVSLVACAAALAAPAAAQSSPLHAGPTAADVEALVAGGRLQEAAWAARAAGDSARADALLARLDTVLRAAPRSTAPLGMDSQGVSYTFRLHHDAGIQSIFKVDGSDIFCPSCGAGREVAAYRIDRLLGMDLTPMTILREVVEDGDTLRGSAMYFVAGASEPAETGAEKPDRLRLFDAILGNSDRHDGNWLILADGIIVAIDHNRAIEYRPSTRPRTCWETEVDSIAMPARLGPAFDRYRTLPDDSLAAAVADVLEPALVEQFVAMRARVVDRIERRAAEPRRRLPHDDCPWGTGG